MQLLVFSVYDKATKAYLSPFQSRTKSEAIRSFSAACQDGEHQFSKHAADYHLAYLGVFDDNSGLYTPVSPEVVISALECLPDAAVPRSSGRLPM